MIVARKNVFYLGGSAVLAGIQEHRLDDDWLRAERCEYFVGVGTSPGVHFALGYFLARRRPCLVIVPQRDHDAVAEWKHTESFTLVRFEYGLNVKEAQDAIRAFLPKSYATHEEYLRSPEWAERRQTVLKKWNRRCAFCSGTVLVDVHHNSYDRIGNEDEADLVTLCRACHKKFHGH